MGCKALNPEFVHPKPRCAMAQVGSRDGARNAPLYNENTFLLSARSMAHVIRRPPAHFAPLVRVSPPGALPRHTPAGAACRCRCHAMVVAVVGPCQPLCPPTRLLYCMPSMRQNCSEAVGCKLGLAQDLIHI
jgi:hypothetical protein